MAIPLYLLGPLQFHGWKGTPGLPQVNVGGEVRPGVNGTSIYDLGKWGEPCQVETISGFASYNAAWQAWLQYPKVADLGPVIITLAGYTIQGGKYQVLHVEGEIRRMFRFDVAGDSTLFTAVVRARWSLLPIADLDNL